MLESLPRLRFTDAIDVLLVAALLWTAFAYLRRTRSRQALAGVLLLAAVYLLAHALHLELTVRILQGASAVLVLILVVVFQDDLRRFFEQIAVWGLLRRAPQMSEDAVDVLVRTVARQARTKTGALYVIPGREAPDAFLEGGVKIDARISEPLLLSLFDPHSPGHDGAVLLTGPRLARFAVHLPLSAHHQEVVEGGTRHAAALGLAERTDALAIVVSEERGTVSVARDGELLRLEGPERLAGVVRSFLAETTPGPRSAGRRQAGPRPPWTALSGRWPEAVGAVLLAAALWAAVVPSSDVVTVRRTARVTVANEPAGYRLEAVEPREVDVTFEGPRRYLPEADESLEVIIDAALAELGRRTFRLSPDQVEHAARIHVVGLSPDTVRLSFRAPPVERRDE